MGCFFLTHIFDLKDILKSNFETTVSFQNHLKVFFRCEGWPFCDSYNFLNFDLKFLLNAFKKIKFKIMFKKT